MTDVLPASPSQARLKADLFAHGLLIDSGVPGVVGQGAEFVDVLERVDALLTRRAASDRPERMSFPPVMPRQLFGPSGYLRSFPHLAGTVWSFQGSEADALEQADRADRNEDWGARQRMTDVALVPAACHPVYPALASRGPLPAEGVTIDAGAALVFRHEPSADPARLQAFRQRELVRVGTAAAVSAWRDEWRSRGMEVLVDLGLDVMTEEANDPFFGRSGRLLAANQRAQALKFEILARITEPSRTAVASFNYHLDHFAGQHGVTLAGGEPAHTACLGFGLERIVVALLATHGLAPARWPAPVRAMLWS
jgi:seryl-tRNA synthetase